MAPIHEPNVTNYEYEALRRHNEEVYSYHRKMLMAEIKNLEDKARAKILVAVVGVPLLYMCLSTILLAPLTLILKITCSAVFVIAIVGQSIALVII